MISLMLTCAIRLKQASRTCVNIHPLTNCTNIQDRTSATDKVGVNKLVKVYCLHTREIFFSLCDYSDVVHAFFIVSLASLPFNSD